MKLCIMGKGLETDRLILSLSQSCECFDMALSCGLTKYRFATALLRELGKFRLIFEMSFLNLNMLQGSCTHTKVTMQYNWLT